LDLYDRGYYLPRPAFKITMKEYEDMAIKVGDKVRIEIRKVDKSGF
jgi:hypothetical protein